MVPGTSLLFSDILFSDSFAWVEGPPGTQKNIDPPPLLGVAPRTFFLVRSLIFLLSIFVSVIGDILSLFTVYIGFISST